MDFFRFEYAILSFKNSQIKHFRVSRGVIFFKLLQHWTEKILLNKIYYSRTASLGGELVDFKLPKVISILFQSCY